MKVKGNRRVKWTPINALDEARLVRKRKNMVAERLSTSLHEVSEVLWLHPNSGPIHLDFAQVQQLKAIRRTADEILERHKEAV